MPDYRITCINKSDRADRHHAIEAVGGENWLGIPFKFTQQDAVHMIDTGQATFYVQMDGLGFSRRVKVITEPSNYLLGSRYLKTEADGLLGDNLLSLPPCPPSP